VAGEVTYQLNEADYVAAQRDHLLRRMWSRGALASLASGAAAAATTLAVIGLLSGDGVRAAVVAAGAGLLLGPLAILVLWGVSFALLPKRARRLYRQHRSLQKEVSYGWSEAGLSYRSANGSGEIAWQDFHRWSEGPHAFLFYLTDQLFHFVIRRQLSETEAADLRNTASALGPERR
jgi:YcxB-like protein